jgi:hypothetical protein
MIVSESGIKWMNGRTERQCDRALGVPRVVHRLVRVAVEDAAALSGALPLSPTAVVVLDTKVKFTGLTARPKIRKLAQQFE